MKRLNPDDDHRCALVREFLAAAESDPTRAFNLVCDHPWLRQAEVGDVPLLHNCATENNAAAIKTMIACGFDVNAHDDARESPLGNAVAAGSVDAVRVLLEAGADCNIVDHGAFPALHTAIVGSEYECVELLLAYGAKTDYRNIMGDTVVTAVAQSADPPRMRMLLRDYGCNV